MLTLTHRQSADAETVINLTLALTAEERTRSRHLFATDDGEVVCLRLARGTVLGDGDVLVDQTGMHSVRVVAKPESVLRVSATSSLLLLKAAYHLGNRHVPVEINLDCLRLLPDPVLQTMLEGMGLDVVTEMVPFHPESGAYGHHHHS